MVDEPDSLAESESEGEGKGGVEPEPDDDARGTVGRTRRWAWRALALVCVGLGSAGAVLPLLPTTPFLLVAAFAASRSSPRLHAWLYQHPRFGPLLRDWRDHRAIRPRAKAAALALLALSWAVIMVTVASVPARVGGTVAIVLVAAFLATRSSGPASVSGDATCR